MNTQTELKEFLNYNPKSGVFLWIIDVGTVKAGNVAGTITKSGYNQIRINKTNYWAHRLAWLYVFGSLPKLIDHINGIGTDNRISNLRETQQLQNCWNRSISKNNTTGVKGVHFHKKERRYKASISKNYKRYNIGSFKTLKEAKDAIEEFRTKLHGEFAKHG